MSDVPSRGELILFRAEDGREAIRLRVVDGTVWLTEVEVGLSRGPVVKESLTTDAGERGATATCKDYLQVHQRRATQPGLSP